MNQVALAHIAAVSSGISAAVVSILINSLMGTDISQTIEIACVAYLFATSIAFIWAGS